MSQLVSCPHCKRTLQLPTGVHVPQVRCPHCKGVFVPQMPRPAPLPVPPPVATARVAARACPACQALLASNALACLECGHLLANPPATAIRPAALPLPPSAPPSTPPRLDVRPWPPALRLLPAGLLALILLGFMVRDRFVGSNSEEEEPETPLVELPIDPDPLLAVTFQQSDDRHSGTLRFGLTMRTEMDDKGKPKRLTFADDGDTNTAVTQIDGKTFLFGKFVFGTGGSDRKGDRGDFTVDSSKELPILRGSWRDPGKPLGKDRRGRERIGQQSIYSYKRQHIDVTQTVEIVPGEQVAAGQTKRRLDTCQVRYRIDNPDDKPHRVAFRFVLDTFIGGNDGVPFTIPGASGLCDTSKDFPTPASVPDFIQALERPSLDNPGTIAHLTLRLGGRINPPDRVTLCHWINQLHWGVFEEPHVDWQFPIKPMRDDSCVVLYWDAKELPPKGHRELGFAYGLGHVSSGEGGGKLGLTVGGSFRPGDEFTVTAYVNEPLPRQTVSLELPRGLTRADGEATQNVPALPADAVSRNSPVTWKVKAARPGRYTLRVKASNGVTQTQAVTITSNGIFD